MDQEKLLQIQSLPTPRRRLVHFGVSALLLWLGARYLHFGNPESISFLEDDRPWPLPSGVSIDHCAEWSEHSELNAIDEFPYSAEARFELPVSTDTLFLISRHLARRDRNTLFSTGHVHFLQSEHASDSVKVDVTAHYRREKHLEAAKACLLERDGAKSGVGFLTEWDHEGGRRHNHEKLRFQVTVTFPRTSDKSSLSINNLSTDLLIFSQTFGDLSNIAFKSLLLKGAVGGILAESLFTKTASIGTSVGPIKIQSLLTESANVTNSVGPIEGTFSASKSLTLSTSNGALNVDVNLSNDAEGEATQLKLFNNIASIRGNITLTSAKDGAATKFDIHARTSTSPLALDVLDAPLGANITLRGSSSFGPVDVSLPTTFEGVFDAATSLSKVSVTFDEEAEDPAGEGRNRRGEYERVGGTTRGTIGWSEEGKTRGLVSVRTSVAPVTLRF
ncbi:hypothetical protein DFH08DRAFT_959800 [Mycena albidolilacea]|uniref:DUF7330 domain-containing protein n=1 Tax=Mycena albidolilacea TaxID=1033008 RepID=A0AAD7A2S4_9AGAR|nr:hypothetical protein DFH08DRAFT_959800 [Mycena albidolilacea]